MIEVLSWLDGIDIAVVAMGIYLVLLMVRKTRTHLFGAGLISFGGFYLLALTAELRLTAFIFHIFFTVIVVVLVVLFQNEIRHFFERFALWIFVRSPLRQRRHSLRTNNLDIIANTALDFADDKIGALIVFQGHIDLHRHTHGGTFLRGQISEPLLKSIFDPHSIGHDGAMIVIANQIDRFGCHLRLSTQTAPLKDKGTRHAAALGLSEDTDALCLIVSEERGRISLAHEGQLETIEDTSILIQRLEQFFIQHYPNQNQGVWHLIGRPDIKLALISIAASFALWFFCIHDAAIEYRSYTVPVNYSGLAQNLKLEQITPPKVTVVVSAARRQFYFKRASDFPLTVRLFEAKLGSQEITLVASDVDLPDQIKFENIWPRNIQVKVGDQHNP